MLLLLLISFQTSLPMESLRALQKRASYTTQTIFMSRHRVLQQNQSHNMHTVAAKVIETVVANASSAAGAAGAGAAIGMAVDASINSGNKTDPSQSTPNNSNKSDSSKSSSQNQKSAFVEKLCKDNPGLSRENVARGMAKFSHALQDGSLKAASQKCAEAVAAVAHAKDSQERAAATEKINSASRAVFSTISRASSSGYENYVPTPDEPRSKSTPAAGIKHTSSSVVYTTESGAQASVGLGGNGNSKFNVAISAPIGTAQGGLIVGALTGFATWIGYNIFKKEPVVSSVSQPNIPNKEVDPRELSRQQQRDDVYRYLASQNRPFPNTETAYAEAVREYLSVHCSDIADKEQTEYENYLLNLRYSGFVGSASEKAVRDYEAQQREKHGQTFKQILNDKYGKGAATGGGAPDPRDPNNKNRNNGSNNNESKEKEQISRTREDIINARKELKASGCYNYGSKGELVLNERASNPIILNGSTVYFLVKDLLHNEFETYDKNGKHLGSLDPVTLKQVPGKGPDIKRIFRK